MIPFTQEDRGRITAWIGRCPGTTAEYLHCPDEETWLDERANGIGASEVGVIVGASQWASPYALWWRKKLGWRIPGSESMRWGHLVEDPIATLFAEQRDDLYLAKPLGHPYSLWYHPISMWAMCTPDRLAVRRDVQDVVPVELKSDEGGSGWGAPETDEVPEAYRCQALWQAFVFGAAGTFVVRKRSRGRLAWYWVPFDQQRFQPLFDAAGEFLASIGQDDAPPPDGSSATEDALRELNPVVEDTFEGVPMTVYARWVAARNAKRDAAAEEKLWSNRMREAMGTAQFATVRTDDGLDVVVAKRRVGKREGYSVPPGTVDELRRVGDGVHAPRSPVPEPDDAAPSAAAEEEGTDSGGRAGGELGNGDHRTSGEEAAGEDPGRTALTCSWPDNCPTVIDCRWMGCARGTANGH